MLPLPMLLPRRLLVGGVTTVAAKPISLSFSLLSVGLGLGCRRSPSSSSSSSSSRRFSSNAEHSTGGRRRWWSDEARFDDEDFDEEEEEEGFSFGGSAREQVLDEPWFTKASRAYGYLLPVILASVLAATGPRAFLMAMAIPLAQSALSLAVRAFSGAFGRRRRGEEDYDDDDDDGGYYSDYRSSGWESEDGEDSSSYWTKYRSSSSRSAQQPWAKDAASEVSGATADSDGTVNASSGVDAGKNGSGSAGFGGWDELDGAGAGDGQYTRSSSRRRQRAGPSLAPDTAAAATGGAARSVGSRRPQPDTATTRRRRPRSRAAAAARYRGQSPLLMRLLVAVFPFLGSWFRIHRKLFLMCLTMPCQDSFIFTYDPSGITDTSALNNLGCGRGEYILDGKNTRGE